MLRGRARGRGDSWRGTRSAEITLPGFVHDLGSAIHPLGYASPFFRSSRSRSTASSGSTPCSARPPVRRWHGRCPGALRAGNGRVSRLRRASLPEAHGERGRRRPKASILLCRLATADPSPHRPGCLGAACAPPGPQPGRERVRGRGAAPFAGNAAHSFLPLEKSPSALFGLLLGTLGHASAGRSRRAARRG